MIKWLLIIFAVLWAWSTWGWAVFAYAVLALALVLLLVLVFSGLEHRNKARAAGRPTGSFWSHIKAELQETEKREAEKREAAKLNSAPQSVPPAEQAAAKEGGQLVQLRERAPQYSDAVAPIAPDKFHMLSAGSVIRDEPPRTGSGGSRRKSNSKPQKNRPTLSSALLPAVFRFAYTDSALQSSERTVKVMTISTNGGFTYLSGYCEDRKELRTFRTDRIDGTLTNMDTGEIIPVQQLLSDVPERTETDFVFSSVSPAAPARRWEEAVFFAGFRGNKYDELEGLALASGWQVRSTISRTVDYVVANGSAGSKQLSQAESLGIAVIDEDAFRALVL